MRNKIFLELGLFKLAVEKVNEQVIITDAEGVILYGNPAATRITGLTLKQMLGKKVGSQELWGGLGSKSFYQELWRTVKITKKDFKGQINNKRKNGEIYQAEVQISPSLDEGGRVRFFVEIERDITNELKQNEQLERHTKELEERNRVIALAKAKDEALLGSIGEGIVVTDENGYVVLINEAAEQLVGWKNKEVRGKKWAEVVPLQDEAGQVVPPAQRATQLVLKNKGKVYFSSRYYVSRDGLRFPVATTAAPVILEGKVIGVIAVFRNIIIEKEIDRAKSEFVSLASHQLRTPLSAINWYAEMLLAGDIGKISLAQKKYLEQIYNSNQRMVALVNSLLNVSRIELGTYLVEPKAVKLSEISSSVISELLPEIKNKKLTISEKYSQNLPIIQADPNLVRIIFQNLLSNAIKYTPAGGRVAVEIAVQVANPKDILRGRGSILIKVSDSGYGVPKSQQSQIFTKLFRADNVKIRETEGNGLGLYLVKRILDSAEGKIWFESQENKGTTFYVTFPLEGMKYKAGSKKLAG